MLVVCVFSLVAAATALAGDVPPEFRDLFIELAAGLDRFERRLALEAPAPSSPVLYSAELAVGDSHRGDALLDTNPAGVIPHLDGLAALGAGAVTVNISLPLLHPAFHRSTIEEQAFLAFYRRLAADVRRRGLRLIVKTQAVTISPDPRVEAFYRGIDSLDGYIRARVEVARTIARELAPDVLIVQMEPDVEAYVTGQPVDRPAQAAAMVSAIVDAVRIADRTVMVGAGAGTWFEPFDEHLDLLTRIDGLDFIDLHVYLTSRTYLDRILSAVDLARSRGKRVGISEAWLYKLRDSEIIYAPFLPREVVGRDVFDFWAPLDQRFLQLLAATAHHQGIAYISPFWTKYFYAYLDYGRTASFDPTRLIVASTAASVQALFAGEVTLTGLRYRQLAALGVRPGR
jgi:hypothetical protein